MNAKRFYLFWFVIYSVNSAHMMDLQFSLYTFLLYSPSPSFSVVVLQF